jgi:PPOX class probable FMN-dependent enzyme
METTTSTTIDSVAELRRYYGEPSERAVRKQRDRLDEHARAFIAASPFVLLATSGLTAGVDCSPRGDAPGFVEVLDDQTLLLPDRRGNNRIDSLCNIVETGQVGLIFLIPGVNETFRVNGRATISIEPGLLERCAVGGTPPRSVIVVMVEEAFMQCARALLRSDLWNSACVARREDVPSGGTMLAAHTGGLVDAAEYDAAAKQLQRESLT